MPPNPKENLGLVVEDDGNSNKAQLLRKRKLLVQQTWGVVEKVLDVRLTRMFYEELFQRHPEVVAMFQNTNMDFQARKLYDVVGVVVRFLDNLDEILPTLQELGVRHTLSYGVERGHYDAVTEIFIALLNRSITVETATASGGGGSASGSIATELEGAVWSLDVADAWSWVLTLIGDTMADAGEAALRQRQQHQQLEELPPAAAAVLPGEAVGQQRQQQQQQQQQQHPGEMTHELSVVSSSHSQHSSSP